MLVILVFKIFWRDLSGKRFILQIWSHLYPYYHCSICHKCYFLNQFLQQNRMEYTLKKICIFKPLTIIWNIFYDTVHNLKSTDMKTWHYVNKGKMNESTNITITLFELHNFLAITVSYTLNCYLEEIWRIWKYMNNPIVHTGPQRFIM